VNSKVKKKKKEKYQIVINYNTNTDYLKVIYMITKDLPVKRIILKITSRIRTFCNKNYNTTRY